MPMFIYLRSAVAAWACIPSSFGKWVRRSKSGFRSETRTEANRSKRFGEKWRGFKSVKRGILTGLSLTKS